MSDFTNAKVGYQVFICSGGWSRWLAVATIEKVGKIHVTVRATKYNMRGRRAGDSSWSGDSLQPFDAAEWEAFKEERRVEHLRRRLQEFNWRNCDKELLLKFAELLPKEVKSNG